MRCEDITEEILTRASELDHALHEHLADCLRCDRLHAGVKRLDRALGAALMVEPPRALQLQLTQLVLAAVPPPAAPWWRRMLRGDFSFEWPVLRPNVFAVQGLAAVMLALTGWQVFGWLSTYQPIVGDVGYAMQILAASPAVVYLGGFQLDVQSLGLWSLVGMAGWLVSESSSLGRRLTTLVERFRLP